MQRTTEELRHDAVAYVIEFKYPEATLYAGLHEGALGWAPSPDTALIFDTREDAERVLANGYGPGGAEYGVIVEV